MKYNDQCLYAIYKLFKNKGSWFESCHKEAIEVVTLLMNKELIANSRGLLGKIMGTLVKDNTGVVDMMIK